jgi:para-aminobenzoate N-oxygenase AurF
MCGIAGFFTGCVLADSCASPALSCPRHGTRVAKDIFTGWYDKASVRSAPRRMLKPGDENRDLFPRELVPFLRHPVIASQFHDRIHVLLCLALYRYLTYTINIELFIVNGTTKKLATGASPVPMDGQNRLHALKIYCDEAYHALFCTDLLDQARRLTGIHPSELPAPRFLRMSREMCGNSDRPELLRLLLTIVSETLITASLGEVGRGEGTPTAVRENMVDHIVDEARHHVFYRDVLYGLMAASSRTQRVKIGAEIPRLIMAFMAPDLESIAVDLRCVGLTKEQTAEVVHDSYASEMISAHARKCGSTLLGYLADLEILHEQEVVDAMAQHNLHQSAA